MKAIALWLHNVIVVNFSSGLADFVISLGYVILLPGNTARLGTVSQKPELLPLRNRRNYYGHLYRFRRSPTCSRLPFLRLWQYQRLHTILPTKSVLHGSDILHIRLTASNLRILDAIHHSYRQELLRWYLLNLRLFNSSLTAHCSYSHVCGLLLSTGYTS